ncbi:MAG: hypothetical protein PHC88_09565 [Terrimicrobiaceae bacterium]|nr:hypothetical protein [Terrimicrobiaceae bacterium]
MNRQAGAAVIALLLVAPGMSIAAGKPSKLSGFAGSYSGTLSYSAGGTNYSGTTQGTISASKTKEVGTVALSAVLSNGGPSIPFEETFAIRNRTLHYTLSADGAKGSGSASAGVHLKTISYSGTVKLSGATISFFGTITRNKGDVRITETLLGTTRISVIYVLKRRAKS